MSNLVTRLSTNSPGPCAILRPLGPDAKRQQARCWIAVRLLVTLVEGRTQLAWASLTCIIYSDSRRDQSMTVFSLDWENDGAIDLSYEVVPGVGQARDFVALPCKRDVWLVRGRAPLLFRNQ